MMLVVKIDVGYHDATANEDLCRDEYLRKLGWTVLRFKDKDVEHDAEAVARAITKKLNLPYEFQKRNAAGSGMMTVKSVKRKAK